MSALEEEDNCARIVRLLEDVGGLLQCVTMAVVHSHTEVKNHCPALILNIETLLFANRLYA